MCAFRKGKRTISIGTKNSFMSAGIGRDGPYLSVRRNLDSRTGIKASIGTRGFEMGADHRITRNTRIGAGYNFARKKAYGEVKYRKRKFRSEI